MFSKKSKAKKDNDTLLLENQKLREAAAVRRLVDELLLENQKLREENEKLKEEQKIIMRDRTYFINSGLIADSRLKDTYQKMKKLEKDLETERSLSSKLDMKMKKVRFS